MPSFNACIIGINSKIVNSIAWPHNYKRVSHKDLASLNLDDFSVFILFSWSHANQEDNLHIFEHLRGRRVIFVSTIAVFSLLVRRQWNKYPNEKRQFEEYYWSEGGSIIRLGVCSKNYISKVAYSSPSAILNAVKQCVEEKQQRVLTPIEILDGDGMGFLERVFHSLSFWSQNRFWRVFCELVVKFSARGYTPLYGYTADCTNILTRPIQLGYGAIGSQNPEAKKCQIVVDPRPNLKLERNGFRDTWIGRDVIGLSKLWHGVRVVKRGDNFYKNVPFLVKRKKAPFDAISNPVVSIDFADRSLKLETDLLVSPKIPYRDLYLAMGALQNTIEISKNLKTSISLSDHSIASIGTLKTRELVGAGYIKKNGFLLVGRRVFVSEDKEFMLDFRPPVAEDNNLGENFYNQQSAGVVQKILQRFTFSRLNQAFFNKFGICVWVNEMDVWGQFLMRDCITVSGDKVIKKKDAAKLAEMLSEVKVQFANIRTDN